MNLIDVSNGYPLMDENIESIYANPNSNLPELTDDNYDNAIEQVY